MSEKENFDYFKIKDKFSEKKACVDGIFYYYNKIATRIIQDPDFKYTDTLTKFGSILSEYMKTDDNSLLMEMDKVFDEFYPGGTLAPEFVSHDLRYAFDGISEYLMRLKNMHML